MKRKYQESLYFFDPVEMENRLINAKTNMYIRQVGADAFVISAALSALKKFPYDPHLWHRGSIYAATPHESQAKQYWPIPNKSFFRKQLKNYSKLYQRLFSEDETLQTTAIFTSEEIYLLTGIRPDESNVCFFDTTCNQEHVNALERARLTEVVFFEWLKGYFEDNITSENIDDIEEAVEALYASKDGKVTEEAHREALKALDITRYAKDVISPQLKQGSLDGNTNSDIETLLALKPTYSTYAEQYFLQTNLDQIVLNEREKITSEQLSFGSF